MSDDSTTLAATAAYRTAEQYVTSLIFGPPTPPPGTPPEVIRERAVARLERLRAFLAFLGNPQLRYRTIHIGGTSGKGSTTAIVGSILRAAGFRVGVHVSPYLQVATEKLEIDGRLIAADRYLSLVESMRVDVERWVAGGNERPNYGEFWVAMMLRYFAEENVDVAVIEVGAGGRFDVTNVIQPDVVAITSIGYDHMVTLGSTLPEIAWHKAGIIKAGCIALTGVTDPDALHPIRDEARRQRVPLIHVELGSSWRDVRVDPAGTSFTDVPSGDCLHLPLPGDFQAANAALAVAVARAFAPLAVTDAVVSNGLAHVRFPGRLEQVQATPLVMLDGAHNPDKIQSLFHSLRLLFAEKRIIAVVGVLESKSHQEMLALLAPHVGALITTAPRVLAKPPVSAEDLAAEARPLVASVHAVADPLAAVEHALAIAGPEDLVLVTGSLYLIGNVRERWYRSEAILAGCNPWPAQPTVLP